MGNNGRSDSRNTKAQYAADQIPYSNLIFDVNTVFQTIVKSSPLPLIIFDLNGTILHMSQSSLMHFGCTSIEELAGKNVMDLIHPKDRALAEESRLKTLKEGLSSGIKFTLLRKDGSTFEEYATTSVLKNARGEPAAIIGIFDVQTDVKLTEEGFKFLFDNVEIGAGIAGLDGKVIIQNRAMHRIFKQPLDKDIDIGLYYANPDDRKLTREMLFEKGEIHNCELEFKREDGEKFWGVFSAKSTEFKGKPAFITSFIDMTERKKAEASMKNLLEETRKMSEMKTNIITFASHELKTPLIPIIGWADYILKIKQNGVDLNEKIEADELESILRNSLRLQRIIDDFLDVGRIQGNKLSINLSWVNLKKIVDSAIRSVSHLVESRKNLIHNEIEDVKIFIDDFRIEKVLVNLLSNSIKYSPPQSEIWLKSYLNHDNVIINVEDQGFGFTPEELKDALQPFSTSFSHSRGERMFSGTGVGLYICKGIIERHKGKIEVTSQGKNQGTKVTVTLPLQVLLDG